MELTFFIPLTIFDLVPGLQFSLTPYNGEFLDLTNATTNGENGNLIIVIEQDFNLDEVGFVAWVMDCGSSFRPK